MVGAADVRRRTSRKLCRRTPPRTTSPAAGTLSRETPCRTIRVDRARLGSTRTRLAPLGIVREGGDALAGAVSDRGTHGLQHFAEVAADLARRDCKQSDLQELYTAVRSGYQYLNWTCSPQRNAHGKREYRCKSSR